MAVTDAQLGAAETVDNVTCESFLGGKTRNSLIGGRGSDRSFDTAAAA